MPPSSRVMRAPAAAASSVLGCYEEAAALAAAAPASFSGPFLFLSFLLPPGLPRQARGGHGPFHAEVEAAAAAGKPARHRGVASAFAPPRHEEAGAGSDSDAPPPPSRLAPTRPAYSRAELRDGDGAAALLAPPFGSVCARHWGDVVT